uniref:Uncharacterized protein n=1 Tax=Octopus bimaculoides TaxID=37653 RepID=A0A0L8HCL0_OCTBM
MHPTGTASLPQSQSSVKPGKDQKQNRQRIDLYMRFVKCDSWSIGRMKCLSLSVPYTPEVTRGESEKTGKNTTDSSLIPSSTTPLGVPASVVIFFYILTIMGLVLLVVVICLLVLCIRARKLMPIFPFQQSFNGLSNIAKNNSTDILPDNTKNKNQQAASLAPLRRHGAGKLSVSLGKDQNGSLVIKSITSKNESKRPALNIKESDTFGAPPRLTRSLTPVHLEVPKRPPLQKLDERPAKNNSVIQSNEVIVEIEHPPTRNRYGKSELQELRQQLTSDRASNNIDTETLCLPSMAVKTPLESDKQRRRKARFNKEINRKSKYSNNCNNRSNSNNEVMFSDRKSLKRSEGRRSFRRSPEIVKQSSASRLNHRLKRYSPGNTIRKLTGIERAELPKTEQGNASTVSRLPAKCKVTSDDCSGIKERPPSVPPRTWIMEQNIKRISSPSFQKRDDCLNQSLNVYDKSSLLATKEEILSKRISMSLDRTRYCSNRNSDETLLPLAVDVDHSSTTLSSSYEDTWPPKIPPTVQTSYGIPCQPATITTKENDNVDGDDNNNNNRHKNTSKSSKYNKKSNDILKNEEKRKSKKYKPTLGPDNLGYHTDPHYINMSRSSNARKSQAKSLAESTNTSKTSWDNVPESDNVYASKSYSTRCDDGYLEPFLRSSCLEADLIARAKLELILKYAEQQRQLKILQKQQTSETLENLSSTLDVEDVLGITSNFTDISTERNKMDKRISSNNFERQKSLRLTGDSSLALYQTPSFDTRHLKKFRDKKDHTESLRETTISSSQNSTGVTASTTPTANAATTTTTITTTTTAAAAAAAATAAAAAAATTTLPEEATVSTSSAFSSLPWTEQRPLRVNGYDHNRHHHHRHHHHHYRRRRHYHQHFHQPCHHHSFCCYQSLTVLSSIPTSPPPAVTTAAMAATTTVTLITIATESATAKARTSAAPQKILCAESTIQCRNHKKLQRHQLEREPGGSDGPHGLISSDHRRKEQVPQTSLSRPEDQGELSQSEIHLSETNSMEKMHISKQPLKVSSRKHTVNEDGEGTVSILNDTKEIVEGSCKRKPFLESSVELLKYEDCSSFNHDTNTNRCISEEFTMENSSTLPRSVNTDCETNDSLNLLDSIFADDNDSLTFSSSESVCAPLFLDESHEKQEINNLFIQGTSSFYRSDEDDAIYEKDDDDHENCSVGGDDNDDDDDGDGGNGGDSGDDKLQGDRSNEVPHRCYHQHDHNRHHRPHNHRHHHHSYNQHQKQLRLQHNFLPHQHHKLQQQQQQYYQQHHEEQHTSIDDNFLLSSRLNEDSRPKSTSYYVNVGHMPFTFLPVLNDLNYSYQVQQTDAVVRSFPDSYVQNRQSDSTNDIQGDEKTAKKNVSLKEAYTTGEFFGAVGVLLLIIIILIAVILLGYCWWRKRKEDESYSEANSANTKPFAKAEYDSISKTSSKMNGVDNNAANLSDALESGQLPKEDYDSVPPPDTSNFIEKTENENLYTTFGPSIHGNAVGDSVTDDKPPIDTVVNDQLESIPTPSSFPEDVDGINDYTEVASQLSSEAPVTMTFADLGKKSNVSFADDNNLLQDDNDGEDNNQTDGLSYVEHINNGGGDDDDDHSNSANKFGEKPNEEEMTWVVADNDGNQHGQDDAEQQADEGSPEETQNQLSQNNEIAYAPLLDDSQRDSWGATNPQYENARL